MRKRRKVIAAGWYVGVGVTFVLASVPPRLFARPGFRETLFVLGVICLCGAAYEWWFRKTDESTEDADRLSLGRTQSPQPEMERHTVAEIRLLCDDWTVASDVTNHGPGAVFSAMLFIKGPVKGYKTRDIYCQWAHTPLAEARIAKGQTCRLVVADRLRDTGMAALMGFSWWVIHAISDGHPLEIESAYHSNSLAKPEPAAAPDITIEIEITATPDFADGVHRERVMLHAFGAAAE